jgi:hypothetical protein
MYNICQCYKVEEHLKFYSTDGQQRRAQVCTWQSCCHDGFLSDKQQAALISGSSTSARAAPDSCHHPNHHHHRAQTAHQHP